ncbi:hypothetical protein [Chromobacterium sp. IIBBL 290-4]|uniref:hypothetical protein n=1 Tax=Chromobacterium sp. IIBBL 290-4 TaxID=2953890 RepID=UPI0020B80CCD|nr:hypothetical protein [Chromobacterium sp. IIBBL 290-4]UTH74315.1 hypothetical protein NKT35_22715 [Chromobacterium sp. IIBBL 290-4]
MQTLKLFQLLKYFNRHQERDTAEFRLFIVCDKAVITTLRKRLFWEMHELGLRASQVTIGPDASEQQCKLSVIMSCPLSQRPQLDDMALRLSQLPEIHRVHWGRRLSSVRPAHRLGAFAQARAKAA